MRATPTDAAPLTRAGELPKLAGGLVLFVATNVMATGRVRRWEARGFALVNDLDGRLEPVLWLPMQLGSLFGPFVVAGASWLSWRRWRPTLGSLLTGIVAWQLAKLVKHGVERARPGDALPQIVWRWGTPRDGLGFVSGHSSVAFAVATVLSPYLSRPRRLVAYALATIVSLARIHVGAHFPLDCVGGAALGVTLGHAYNATVGIPDVEGSAEAELAALAASAETDPVADR